MCKTVQNRCITGLILGRVFKIRKSIFYSSANDMVKYEFANDSKCANAPSLPSTNSGTKTTIHRWLQFFLTSSLLWNTGSACTFLSLRGKNRELMRKYGLMKVVPKQTPHHTWHHLAAHCSSCCRCTLQWFPNLKQTGPFHPAASDSRAVASPACKGEELECMWNKATESLSVNGYKKWRQKQIHMYYISRSSPPLEAPPRGQIVSPPSCIPHCHPQPCMTCINVFTSQTVENARWGRSLRAIGQSGISHHSGRRMTPSQTCS